jgi:hypothetical protein
MDSLPTTCNENEADEDDSESIHDEDREDEEWRAEWMQEAGRHPNQSVEMDFKNLGARELDLQYDWVENSPGQDIVTTASKWLAERTKESPNDGIPELPELDYRKLKGEQRNVFLQVMAYFKKLKSGDQDRPETLQLVLLALESLF